jgi:hypothetical protein
MHKSLPEAPIHPDHSDDWAPHAALGHHSTRPHHRAWLTGIYCPARTFRTCGPRNEMLGWKVKFWSGASRRWG